MPVPATAGSEVEVLATLKTLIFSSPPRQNGSCFSVWAVESDEGEFTATAPLPGDAWGSPGDDVVLVGQWQDHPRYGRQLAVTSVRPFVPAGAKGLIRWLTRQPGIGQVTATKVVRALGDEAMAIISQDPAAVDKIPGLTGPQREAVRLAAAQYQQDRARAEVLVWCHRYGFGPAQAEAIWEAWQEAAPEILAQDPWALTSLDGFGFLTADDLARRLGVAPHAPARMEAATEHVLRSAASDEGHVYLPRPELVRRTVELLKDIARRTGYGGGDPVTLANAIQKAVDAMVGREDLICAPPDRVYLRWLYDAEDTVRSWLVRRRQAPGLLSPDEARAIAFDPEVRGKLDEVQAGAVAMALANGASVLTGGPGTGKTATTRAVLAAIRRVKPKAKILLAAPTGRAARRMSEVTGEPAQTIHRLLEFGPDGDTWTFHRDARYPLEGDYLIIDETSMVDIQLMAALVRAIPPGMGVLFVGDADQLPPVGPGAPFHAIVNKGLLPVTRLERIYRQGAGSPIPVAARAVNKGMVPREVPGDRTLRIVVHQRPPRHLAGQAREEAARKVRQRMADDVLLAVRALRDKYGFAPDEIQVLTPSRRGACGTAELNQRLRAELNPDGKHRGMYVAPSGREFWLGDRVMQVTNNYRKGVFNGEQGRVVEVNVPVRILTPKGVIERTGFVVEFDDGAGGRRVPYYSGDAHELDLAYATTIHKSQGSEYPAVVMVMGWDSFLLLQRQLLYTGITRASRHLIIIAEEGTLARAVETVDGVVRFQALEPEGDAAEGGWSR